LSSARTERPLAESACILVFTLRPESLRVSRNHRRYNSRIERVDNAVRIKRVQSVKMCRVQKIHVRIAEAATKGPREGIPQRGELLWRRLL
jgi:hypothetical protein